MSIQKVFGEEERNVLLTALFNAAGGSDNDSVYDFLENTPKTSLISELVNEINNLGYHITKI